MSSKVAPVIFLSLFLFAAMFGSARAAIPGGDDPKVFTEHEFRQQRLEFGRRMTVEAYKQVGKRDPKWDAPALALLDGMAQASSNSGADNFYSVPTPDLNEIEKQGRLAIAAGCDDPLVMDLFCLMLDYQNKQAEIPPLQAKATDGVLQSQYSVYRAVFAIKHALKFADKKADPVLFNKYQRLLYDSMIALAKAPDAHGLDLRFILGAFESDFDAMPLDQQKDFFDKLVSTKADPWITNIIGGKYYIRSAWASRGSGLANTVTVDGWRGMQDQLAKAHACLTTAYEMHPEFPEAATQLITVAMGETVGPGESLRGWFDLAVKAQFDFAPAYANYRQAIWPRWFGSFAEMYQFGLECADTRRFDTRVPFVLVQVLYDILNDSQMDWSFWRLPGRVDRVADVLTNYAPLAKRPDNRTYFYAHAAAAAWQVGRYDLGRSVLDKMGPANDPGLYFGFTVVGVLPTRSASGIYAFTGPNGDAVRDAETHVSSQQFDQAIDGYKTLVQQTPHDDRSYIWLAGRLQELIWQQQFIAGQWVDLMPKADLAGWYPLSGKFTSDGKAITGITENSHWGTQAALICGVKFGTRYEIRAQTKLPLNNPKAIQTSDGVGLIYGWINTARNCYGYVRPVSQDILWRTDGETPEAFPHPIDAIMDMSARRWDENIETSFQNRIFYPYNPIGTIGTCADPRIGIGAVSASEGVDFSVTDIQIRRLDKEP